MNYIKIYEKLIDRAKNRNLETYTETHHIIPRCLSGSDEFCNLVELTPEEHYVAHQLLVKIYPENPKLILAIIRMSGKSIYKNSNNKLYGWLRKRFVSSKKGKPGHPRSESTRQKMKENHVGMTGKNHSEETKQILREKRKLQGPTFLGKFHTDQTKKQMSEKAVGRCHTKESKEKMKGRIISEETRLKLKNSQKIRREREKLSIEPILP